MDDDITLGQALFATAIGLETIGALVRRGVLTTDDEVEIIDRVLSMAESMQAATQHPAAFVHMRMLAEKAMGLSDPPR